MRILIGRWSPGKAALVRNYLEVYWPCVGGLSAVNAINKKLRHPINSGLTRWHMAVYKYKWTPPRNSGVILYQVVSKHQIQPEYGDEQANAGRNCRTRLARPNSQARTRTGNFFPVQLTTSRIGNLTRLILTLAICVTITYIYIIARSSRLSARAGVFVSFLLFHESLAQPPRM